jgi:hypothetical protein
MTIYGENFTMTIMWGKPIQPIRKQNGCKQGHSPIEICKEYQFCGLGKRQSTNVVKFDAQVA